MTNILAWIASHAGWFIAIGILLFAWALVTTHGKGVLFTLAVIFILGPAILRWAPGIWADAGIEGTDNAQSKLCARYGGAYCTDVNLQTVVDQTTLSTNGGSGGGTQYVAPAGAGQSAAPQSATYQLSADSGTIWLTRFTATIGGSLNPTDKVVVGPGMFPAEATVNFVCTNCASSGKDKEKWNFTVIPAESWVNPVTFTANGNVARNLGVSVDRSATNTFTGSGKWETVCPKCLVPVEAAAPIENSGNAVITPTDTPVPLPATNTDPAANQYTVTDSTGADTRSPVGGVCDGDGDGAGTIPFGSVITITQTFPNGGNFAYKGTSDLGLTSDNRCIYMGTVAVVAP